MSTALNSMAVKPAPAQPLREFWGYFSANRGALAGLVIVIGVLLVAMFAPLLAPHAPDLTNNTAFLKPPSGKVAARLHTRWVLTPSDGIFFPDSSMGRDCLSSSALPWSHCQLLWAPFWV